MATMGRAIVSFFLALLFIGVLVGIGTEIYQAGVSQGIIDAGRVPIGANVGVRGYEGPDVLSFFFPILFLFILFGLFRAALFGGRGGWGHHRHGYGGGWGSGWDKGWDKGEGGGPPSWREERERRMADMHRRLHETEGSTGSGAQTGSGAPSGSPAT
jgi:hypothetical protein